MLHDFLKNHRADLIARCRHSAAQRASIDEIGLEAEFGIPLFLDQLTGTLEAEYRAEFGAAEKIGRDPFARETALVLKDRSPRWHV